jgi:hypothetical protein
MVSHSITSRKRHGCPNAGAAKPGAGLALQQNLGTQDARPQTLVFSVIRRLWVTPFSPAVHRRPGSMPGNKMTAQQEIDSYPLLAPTLRCFGDRGEVSLEGGANFRNRTLALFGVWCTVSGAGRLAWLTVR